MPVLIRFVFRIFCFCVCFIFILQESSSTQLLGSRTRPASYGRSSSWGDTPVNTQPGINSVHSHIETASTQSSRPDWATISSWNVVNNQNPAIRNDNPSDRSPPNRAPVNNPFEKTSPSRPIVVTSTETWYPAAGNQIDNEVDEPNQQGLRKPKNTSSKLGTSFVTLTVLVLMTFIC